MMRNEFFKILYTGTLMMLLSQCGTIQGPAYVVPDAPKMQEPMTTTQEQPNDNAEEPQAFDLPTAEAAAPGEELRSDFAAGSATYTMEDYLTHVIYDVHEFWSNIMVEGGYHMPYVYYAFPNAVEAESYFTECGYANKLDAFFCPIDDQIVVTQEMAQQIWDGTFKAAGAASTDSTENDFSVALVVAHEYAHSLQADLGWLRTEPLQEGETYEPLVAPTATENNADCLAGVWANSTYHRGMLETGDIEEAIKTLIGIGDDKLGEAQTHGSSEERVAAFFAGYNSGTASSCDPYLLNAYNGQ